MEEAEAELHHDEHEHEGDSVDTGKGLRIAAGALPGVAV